MKRLFAAAALVALLAGPALAAAPACENGKTFKALVADTTAKGWKFIKLSPEQKQIVEADYNRRDPPTNEHFDAIYIAKKAGLVDPNTGETVVIIVLVRGGCAVGAAPIHAKTLESIILGHQAAE